MNREHARIADLENRLGSLDLSGYALLTPTSAWIHSVYLLNAAQDTWISSIADNRVPLTRTVNGHALTADVTVSKGDVGLGNADNTSDLNKPVSDAASSQIYVMAAAAYADAVTYTNGIRDVHSTWIDSLAIAAAAFKNVASTWIQSNYLASTTWIGSINNVHSTWIQSNYLASTTWIGSINNVHSTWIDSLGIAAAAQNNVFSTWIQSNYLASTTWIGSINNVHSTWIDSLGIAAAAQKNTTSTWIQSNYLASTTWIGSINNVHSTWIDSLGIAAAAQKNTNSTWIQSNYLASTTWIGSLSGVFSTWIQSNYLASTTWIGSLNGVMSTWINSVAFSATSYTINSLLTAKFLSTQTLTVASLLTAIRGTFAGGLLSSSGELGFLVGAGGIITQATNKATGVTLNKWTGQIVVRNSSIAAAGEVSFLVTNGVVSGTDTVIVSVRSGGATAGAYAVNVDGVTDGGFRITMSNLSAGTLSENLWINFAVLRAANA